MAPRPRRSVSRNIPRVGVRGESAFPPLNTPPSKLRRARPIFFSSVLLLFSSPSAPTHESLGEQRLACGKFIREREQPRGGRIYKTTRRSEKNEDVIAQRVCRMSAGDDLWPVLRRTHRLQRDINDDDVDDDDDNNGTTGGRRG